MEMIVAVSILIVIILAVGLIFSSASKAVGVSQKTLDMLSNVRAMQWQLERDLAGLDKNSFMVIRSGVFNDDGPNNGTDRRCDLLTFFSHGTFAHRTGANSASSFTDGAPTSSHAIITWGQLALASSGSTWTNTGEYARNAHRDRPTRQDWSVLRNQVPTGLKWNPDGSLNAADMILGRSAMLLLPRNAVNGSMIIQGTTSMAAFQNVYSSSDSTRLEKLAIDWDSQANAVQPENVSSYITQSRVDVAAIIASQIANFFANDSAFKPARSVAPRFEADRFCFRRAALRSPHDDLNPTTGYFRMHPIVLQGVSEFAVDWTDGKEVYALNDVDVITGEVINNISDPTHLDYNGTFILIGTTKWYGMNNPKVGPAGHLKKPPNTPDAANSLDLHDGTYSGSGRVTSDGFQTGDTYCAIFSYDTPKTKWPVALRFRYHLEDPSGRLEGGRGFVQIVKLPNN